MPAFGPVSRRDLVRALRQAGFEGPYSGGRHAFMVKGDVRLTVPSPHHGVSSAALVTRLLKQAGISREEWERLGRAAALRWATADPAGSPFPSPHPCRRPGIRGIMPAEPDVPGREPAMGKLRGGLVGTAAVLAAALCLAALFHTTLATRRAAAADRAASSPHQDSADARPAKFKLNFDADLAGTVPHEIEVVSGTWTVLADDSAPSQPNALGQLGRGEVGAPFNVCVVRDTSFRDVAVELRFKAVAGRGDQGGGPVWRYRDDRNYYVARYNPLEHNYRV
ncbi:MAG: type II toxin-antitoxin system HicA family toxin [Armatimonadetes bacterium]|nr:type II toxin-antitoxin system HicA family toxin [Armatimonadota bacterium]